MSELSDYTVRLQRPGESTGELVARLYSFVEGTFRGHRHTIAQDNRPATWYFFTITEYGDPRYPDGRAGPYIAYLWLDGQSRASDNGPIDTEQGLSPENYDDPLSVYNRRRIGLNVFDEDYARNPPVRTDDEGFVLDPNTGLPAASLENTLASRFQERLVEVELNETNIFSYFNFNNLEITNNNFQNETRGSIDIEIPFLGLSADYLKDTILRNIKDYNVEPDTDAFELLKIIVASPIGNNKKYLIREFYLNECFNEENRRFELNGLPVDFTVDNTFEISVYAQDINTTEIYDKNLLTIRFPDQIIPDPNRNINAVIGINEDELDALRFQTGNILPSEESNQSLSDDQINSLSRLFSSENGQASASSLSGLFNESRPDIDY